MAEETAMPIEPPRMRNWVMMPWADARGGCKRLCGVGNKRERHTVISDGTFEVDKHCRSAGRHAKPKANEGQQPDIFGVEPGDAPVIGVTQCCLGGAADEHSQTGEEKRPKKARFLLPCYAPVVD